MINRRARVGDVHTCLLALPEAGRWSFDARPERDAAGEETVHRRPSEVAAGRQRPRLEKADDIGLYELVLQGVRRGERIGPPAELPGLRRPPLPSARVCE